jgi:hypothetical protein
MTPTARDRLADRARQELTDTRWDRLRTPQRRRALVVAFAASLAVVAAVFVAADAWGLAALPLPVLAVFALRRSVRTVADLPDEALDERLVRDRDRTYLHAYRILSGLTVVMLVVLQLVADHGTLGYYDLGAAFWAVCLGAIGLPSAVLAWTDPTAP